jgi:hypothetical protein
MYSLPPERGVWQSAVYLRAFCQGVIPVLQTEAFDRGAKQVTEFHRHLTSRPFINYKTVLLAVFLHEGPSHSIPETPIDRNRPYSDIT